MGIQSARTAAKLVLKDGREFDGYSFGHEGSVAGEVVFNTGMVGYQESLTDPSYCGQILALTYPLVGNYGVPEAKLASDPLGTFESAKIQASGLVVSEHSAEHSHHTAVKSLDQWLREHKVPGIYGIDTRALTKHLREHGSTLGKICVGAKNPDWYDPNGENLISRVSIAEPTEYGSGEKTVVVVDCGIKNSIIRSLLIRGVRVRLVPWDLAFQNEHCDGYLISNGPGDPQMAELTVENLRTALSRKIPTFGICLGHQILARAAGAKTYKLKFGHRSQNQPAIEVNTKRCFMTSQNHGYGVDTSSLPQDWEEWFINANDETNEGIRHKTLPFMSVQFHPEAVPGPVDSNSLFDDFVASL